MNLDEIDFDNLTPEEQGSLNTSVHSWLGMFEDLANSLKRRAESWPEEMKDLSTSTFLLAIGIEHVCKAARIELSSGRPIGPISRDLLKVNDDIHDCVDDLNSHLGDPEGE